MIFERALFRTEALRHELERLDRTYAEREDVPGTKVIMRALRLIVGETEREIINEGRRLAGRQNAVRDTDFQRAVGAHISTLERLLPEHLSRARRTHGRDIEAIIGPFSRLADVLSPGRELVFDPVDRYEIVLSSVRRSLQRYANSFSDELHAAIGHLPHVTVVLYPLLAERETLQHAVIGHEVAHVALAEPLEADGPSIGSLVFTQAFAEDVAEVRRHLTTGQALSSRELRAEEIKLRDRSQAWFWEFACDQVGVRLVGPAMLLALHEFAAVRNRWSQEPTFPGYETHPGLAWRLRRLVPEARRFLDVPRNTAPWRHARRVIDQIEDTIPNEHDKISDVERQIIERSLQLLDERLDDHLGGNQFLVGEFERLYDVAWDKLASGIPPAEEVFSRTRPDVTWRRTRATARKRQTRRRRVDRRLRDQRDDIALPDPWSQPMDWRVIVNSAYFFWLSGAALERKSPEVAHMPIDARALKRRAAFNEHVRGTLELSEIQLRLQDVKEQLDEMNFPEG